GVLLRGLHDLHDTDDIVVGGNFEALRGDRLRFNWGRRRRGRRRGRLVLRSVEEGAGGNEGAQAGRCIGSDLGELHGPDYDIAKAATFRLSAFHYGGGISFTCRSFSAQLSDSLSS